MDQTRKAEKVVPSHLRGTDDREPAWKQHHEGRMAEEAARSDPWAACVERPTARTEDIPLKADELSFIAERYFEGHGWGTRVR